MRSASAIYCFNLEHSCLVRSSTTSRITPTDFSGFRLRHLPWRSCLPSDKRSSTQRFHAAVVAPMYRCCWRLLFARASRRILPWRSSSMESVSCLSRPLDAPACESLRSGPRISLTPRPPRSEAREDFTTVRPGTTSIERCTSRLAPLRHPPRMTWN